MGVYGIDHIQLAMPAGRESEARRFFGELLGLAELPKPANLASRGGAWFQCGPMQLHLGVDKDFHPAKKAHPALLVTNLADTVEILNAAGVAIKHDEPLDGFKRVFVEDPFGNRLELLERL